jgi:hypothetical protein
MLEDLDLRVRLEREQRQALDKLRYARDVLNNVNSALQTGISEATDDSLLTRARAEVVALNQEWLEATRRLMDYLMQGGTVRLKRKQKNRRR